jgi:hypothetical protein
MIGSFSTSALLNRPKASRVQPGDMLAFSDDISTCAYYYLVCSEVIFKHDVYHFHAYRFIANTSYTPLVTENMSNPFRYVFSNRDFNVSWVVVSEIA